MLKVQGIGLRAFKPGLRESSIDQLLIMIVSLGGGQSVCGYQYREFGSCSASSFITFSGRWSLLGL